MKRILWSALFLAVAVAGVVFAVVYQANRVRQTEAPRPKLEPPPVAPAEPSEGHAQPAGPQPEAFAPERTYDFGVLEPDKPCKHEFVITNRGKAPLVLDQGRTSCQCTVSKLAQHELAPGESVSVTVASKLDGVEGPFAHRATILTNDPNTPRIELQIEGKIAWVLTSDRSEIRVSCSPNAKYCAPERIVVYSETWKQFEIQDVQCSREGAKWEIAPADEKTLRALGVKAGYVMTVQIPAEQGTENEDVSLDVVAASSETPPEKRTLHLELYQNTRKQVELSGPAYSSDINTLKLGRIVGDEPARQEMLLIVRDPNPVEVTKVETTPGFLKVDVEPVSEGKGGRQLFRVSVEVPQDAPACNYFTGGRLAHVTIGTDGADLAPIEFNVSFAVVSRS